MFEIIPSLAVELIKSTFIRSSNNESSAQLPPIQRSILEDNLDRLDSKLSSSNALRVAIIGQPGAGKSTLLKKITNGEVRPLPKIGIQTDATNWADSHNCSLTSAHNGTIFVDVPGYDTKSHPTQILLEKFPWNKLDAFIFVVKGKLHQADELIFQRITYTRKRICIARSFSEDIDEEQEKSIN